jgi:hypothetical protein
MFALINYFNYQAKGTFEGMLQLEVIDRTHANSLEKGNWESLREHFPKDWEINEHADIRVMLFTDNETDIKTVHLRDYMGK